MSSKKDEMVCWICNNPELKVIKKSDILSDMSSEDFAITNSNYGTTGELSQCSSCGFVQCTDDTNVLGFYEDLVDEQYENTRSERKLQEEGILKLIAKYKPTGSHLDVGAGSGIMVEAATEMGYASEGVEPSKWLQQKASERGLNIHLGVYPHPDLEGKKYDIVTLVDVIEHVDDPSGLVQSLINALNPDGILVIITPDNSSFFAKVLGWKWWHYRIAHIGYFNKKTMALLARNLGLKTVSTSRPAWYFSIKYLVERAYTYLPKFLHLPWPEFINKRVVKVNLRDSIISIYTAEKNV